MLDSVRLDETSSAAVAVTSWHDQLYLAWTGTDEHINLASSPDGREIMGKQRLAQRSYRTVMVGPAQSATPQKVSLAPSLAVSGERLYLAWTGDSALNLLAAEQPVYAAPVTLEERSGHSPSLTAAGNDSLVLAWTGTDRHVNLLTLAGGSSGMPVPVEGAKAQFEEARSGHAPAVCSHQGGLALAWTGTEHMWTGAAGHINILTAAEDPYGAPVALEEVRSNYAPALCSHQGSLVLAWIGTEHMWRGVSGHINILTAAEDPHGAPVRLEEAKSACAPAVCSHQGSLVLAWTGTDGHLNVARLDS